MNIVAQILHHNNIKELFEVIDSIRDQTFEVFKIVLIDNGSDTESIDLIKRLESDKIHVIFNENNLGVGAGHNLGWHYILNNFKTDFIWVLEHDVLPMQDCLEKLLYEFEKLRKCDDSILAAHALESSGMNFNVYSYYTLANWRLRKITDNASRKSYFGGLSFNGLLIPVQTIKKIGFLREDYFIGYEDIDYFRRIESNNGKVLKVEGAIVFHNLYKNRRQIKIGKAFFLYSNETIFRSYYSTRNRLFLDYYQDNNNPPFILNLYRILRSILLIILFKNKKLLRIKCKLIAYKDAKNRSMGKKSYKFLNH